MPQALNWVARVNGPYMAMGCGDAWAILDTDGRLAGEPKDGGSPLTDKETATKIADYWNSMSTATH